jgi:serine/threonine protein kinase
MLKFDPASTGAGQPTVKVLDFGISKMLAEATLVSDPNSGILGSPSYMSPEQAEARNREVGPASDQFSLASIAVELLTEKKAFSGEIPSSILFQVVHREPDGMDIIDRDYPECVGQAIRRALAKEPAKRFPSIAEFLAALGREITAPDLPTAPQKKPAGPTPWWKNALAVLILVGLIAAGTYLALTSPVWKLIFSREPSTTPPAPGKDRPAKAAPAAAAPSAEGAEAPDQTADDDRANYLAAEARRHYDKRKYNEAIRLATQSVAVKPNGDAHVLITLSFCALKQDKDAQIWLKKVPQSRRNSTLAQCRYLGLDLQKPADPKKK